ncbi:unnamed protein product, partial [Ectocarpus fasciculatus]
ISLAGVRHSATRVHVGGCPCGLRCLEGVVGRERSISKTTQDGPHQGTMLMLSSRAPREHNGSVATTHRTPHPHPGMSKKPCCFGVTGAVGMIHGASGGGYSGSDC